MDAEKIVIYIIVNFSMAIGPHVCASRHVTK
jgi:hypothetical protein